jgi:hypothetical protein
VFLAALGAKESEIEASFCAAIKTAKERKSVSLQKRAEATYAEFRRQKASGSGSRGFRLPLCPLIGSQGCRFEPCRVQVQHHEQFTTGFFTENHRVFGSSLP